MLIFMFYFIANESVKIQLEIDIGIWLFENFTNIYDFDVIDCFDICKRFLPSNYVISRENYLFSY